MSKRSSTIINGDKMNVQNVVNIYMKQNISNTIKNRAKEKGLSVSSYLRMLALEDIRRSENVQ